MTDSTQSVREAVAREELARLELALEDMLNEPRRSEEHPDTRDYRHAAYRVWDVYRAAVHRTITLLTSKEMDGSSNASPVEREAAIDKASEPSGPFRLYDRVKHKGQVGDATGSIMAMQRFDHGWECWVHVAAYGSNSIVRADDLTLVRRAPTPASQPDAPLSGGALTTILDWYRSLPKRAREGMSLANLHDLSKALSPTPPPQADAAIGEGSLRERLSDAADLMAAIPTRSIFNNALNPVDARHMDRIEALLREAARAPSPMPEGSTGGEAT